MIDAPKIDPISALIATRYDDEEPIHERLHNMAIQRKMTALMKQQEAEIQERERQFMTVKNKEASINAGNRFHNHGMLMKEERERKVKQGAE